MLVSFVTNLVWMFRKQDIKKNVTMGGPQWMPTGLTHSYVADMLK